MRTLIESWGLVWGRDVLPAPVPGEVSAEEPQLLLPTPEETAAVQASVDPSTQEPTEAGPHAAFLAARRAVNAARQDEIERAMERIRGTA